MPPSIIDFPDGTNLEEMAASLLGFFPTVKYAHPNYVATLTNVPNDPLYADEQNSLHASTPFYNNAHINVEPFWEVETGRPYVKVGVFDTGLDWRHEDFTYDDISGEEASVMEEGWDFITDSSLKTAPDPDPSPTNPDGVTGNPFGHGTNVAGIIGAIRNNSKGVAGIAGGYTNEAGDNFDRGISLYGMRIFTNISGEYIIGSDLEYIANAIANASIDNSNVDGAYGLHIMNHSWGVYSSIAPPSNPDIPLYSSENIQILSDAVHFANRNKVTFVAGRGNDGTDDLQFPATYDDDWVINVGGTKRDGQYKNQTTPTDWGASYGQNLDIAAPCTNELIRTTRKDNEYGMFNGTSSAAPHVAGVAALLMSHVNTSDPSPGNLAPEDIEFVVQETATEVGFPLEYNDLTGFGRLNAGAAFQLIRQPIRFLAHFGTDADPNVKTTEQVGELITLNLTEPYDNADGISFAPGNYYAYVHRVEAVVNHNLDPNDLILHSWERHSSSTLFALSEAGDDLIPHEKVNILSVNQDQAVLEGYTYELISILGTSLGWAPFNPANLDDAELTYSLLLQDNLITETKDVVSTMVINLTPNPANDLIQLDISGLPSSEVLIAIVDVTGRELRTIHQDKKTDNFSTTIDISSLTAGLYYVQVRLDDRVKVRSFVKQ